MLFRDGAMIDSYQLPNALADGVTKKSLLPILGDAE